MRSLEIVNLKSLLGITELKCVEDAWLLIVDCRRMLKWTCAYGYYYLHLHDDNGHAEALFEFLQGEAETLLE